MASNVVIVIVMALVVVMVAGQASAAIPNTYWGCMTTCPVACAIPSTTTTTAVDDDVNHYCKLGCTSTKCFTTLTAGSGAVAIPVEGCIHAYLHELSCLQSFCGGQFCSSKQHQWLQEIHLP